MATVKSEFFAPQASTCHRTMSLTTTPHYKHKYYHDTVSKWLGRRIRHPLCCNRGGSIPLSVLLVTKTTLQGSTDTACLIPPADQVLGYSALHLARTHLHGVVLGLFCPHVSAEITSEVILCRFSRHCILPG